MQLERTLEIAFIALVFCALLQLPLYASTVQAKIVVHSANESQPNAINRSNSISPIPLNPLVAPANITSSATVSTIYTTTVPQSVNPVSSLVSGLVSFFKSLFGLK